MIFTAEVFDNILRHLSRADLEALQLVNSHYDEFVVNNFTTGGPLRQIELEVRGLNHYVVLEKHRYQSAVGLHSSDELAARTKFAVVGRLWLVFMDQSIRISLTLSMLENQFQVQR